LRKKNERFRNIFNEIIYQAAPLVIPSGKTSVAHGFFGDFIFK